MYQQKEKRLSQSTKDKILPKAEEEGFNSCYLYLEFLIYTKEMKPKDIREYLDINEYVYYGMHNRIKEIKRESPKKKEEKKMCGYCGKRPRDGAYYCKKCWKLINSTCQQMDIDMFGDY